MHLWSSGFRHTPAKRNNGGSNPSRCSNKCRSLVEKDIGSYPMLSEFEPHIRYKIQWELAQSGEHLTYIQEVAGS